MEQLDKAFISHASEILGKTNSGLTGSEIVKFCNKYSIDFNVKIPISSTNFIELGCGNKRTALYKNLQAFNGRQQFAIIEQLCELDKFKEDNDVKKLKKTLYERYGSFTRKKLTTTELVSKAKKCLDGYPAALEPYNNALKKYENAVFDRNVLDDMRLSFELLAKGMLKNESTLENQISGLGQMLKEANASVELRNMLIPIIKYYTNFQNGHVKHNDKVNKDEIEFVIELTSVIMKYLIKMNKKLER